MRAILFRGRDHEGKWHKGNLIVTNAPKHKEIIPFKTYAIREQDFEGEEHEVDPKTIGQIVCEATEEPPEIWEGANRAAVESYKRRKAAQEANK